jgi:hypothetical protein
MGKIYSSIKEGDAYSAISEQGFLELVIIEKNDNKRLCYWIYDDVADDYVFHEIVKPSQLANYHLASISAIKTRENEQRKISSKPRSNYRRNRFG